MVSQTTHKTESNAITNTYVVDTVLRCLGFNGITNRPGVHYYGMRMCAVFCAVYVLWFVSYVCSDLYRNCAVICAVCVQWFVPYVYSDLFRMCAVFCTVCVEWFVPYVCSYLCRRCSVICAVCVKWFVPYVCSASTLYCKITFCIILHSDAFGIFLMDPWMCSLSCLSWSQNLMRHDRFDVLGYLIWQLVIEISELGRGIAK